MVLSLELLSNALRISWRKHSPPASAILQSTLNANSNSDTIHSVFHYTWLRDHCPCPKCLHESTQQKLISPAEIPADIKPKAVNLLPGEPDKLSVEWKTSDFHKSIYSMKWLLNHDYSEKAVKQRLHDDDQMQTWDHLDIIKKDGNLNADYSEFMKESDGFRQVILNLQRFGLAFIKCCPTVAGTIETLAKRFGPIYETFYGKVFDVQSVRNAKNIAYTSLYLGLHMDLMYFESPPGLQLLHCLKCSVDGGESIFADSYRAVEILRQNHPDHFKTLCSVPVTFHYRNNGHHLRFRRPLISADTDLNQKYQVYYAPPFQGPLEVNHEQVPRYYAAFREFSQIINSPQLRYQRKLNPGDCVIFANRRVLHGRQAFNGASGERHLQGAYVALDDFKDLRRSLLSEKSN